MYKITNDETHPIKIGTPVVVNIYGERLMARVKSHRWINNLPYYGVRGEIVSNTPSRFFELIDFEMNPNYDNRDGDDYYNDRDINKY